MSVYLTINPKQMVSQIKDIEVIHPIHVTGEN